MKYNLRLSDFVPLNGYTKYCSRVKHNIDSSNEQDRSKIAKNVGKLLLYNTLIVTSSPFIIHGALKGLEALTN